MKLGIIFTNDWELFGDGSGDYFEIQHKPLLNFLNVFDNHGAKLTIMAETFQQWKHKELGEYNDNAENIARAWEGILKETVKRGHDVQLHLHPQWQDAKFQDGNWKLNLEKTKLMALNTDEIEDVFQKGKEYLEELLQSISSKYKCIAFRAGGYCIEPAEVAIRTMKKNGIICDTSVTKDLYSKGFYDFRDAPSKIIPWFTDDKSVCNIGNQNNGILEMPIYSDIGIASPVLNKFFPKIYHFLKLGIKIPYEELNWQKNREEIRNKRYPLHKRYYKTKEQKSLGWYFSKLISKNSIQLNYDLLPATVFVQYLENIFKDPNLKTFRDKDITIPVVALGHMKDIHDDENIKWILSIINSQLNGKIIYWTLRDAVDYWLDYLENNLTGNQS